MEVWFALGITLLAGLATGIGSIIAFTAKRTNYRFLSIATGFSAGVMLYVSFVEIFFKGLTALTERFGDYWGHWVNAGSFFGGMLIIGLIDNLIPAGGNPHEIRTETETMPLHDPSAPLAPSPEVREALHMNNGHHHDHKLMRMGLFTALAIGIHNFPEGLATFLAALEDPHLGIAIGIAIRIVSFAVTVIRAIFAARQIPMRRRHPAEQCRHQCDHQPFFHLFSPYFNYF